ncbi:MAG: phosphate acetyltransferase [candidate division Zixibacteria bacterium HGW-Zixibacteria-1]|nr:MAG: phosphate acetyltransferase [candidate division Zixibacteria bacterium HGW-Zixibacteria-1]
MNILDSIKEKARAKKRKVVLPEGTEPRVIKAAKILVEQKIASVVLLGNKDEIGRLAAEAELNLSLVRVIDPSVSELIPDFAKTLFEKRKHKGITEAQATETVKNVLFFGAMMVEKGMVDGCVAGSVNTTGDVMRAAIQVIGLAPGINTVSGAFMMVLPKFRDEENKIFMYADSAVVPNPDAAQLASIAVSTAETMYKLTGQEPRVAMLSFSTRGSAKHEDVDKVLEALALVRKEHPELKVDGEMQLDAAIIPEIASRKAPGSDVAGKANVLIFPDLDAGNIGYKLTERLAGATATGPIVQGLRLPMNDLSRGCSAQDIVDVSAIAVLMKG